MPKIWRKNLRPFSRYEFSKFGRKIDFFGVRGISHGSKITFDASWFRLGVCQIWSESVKLTGPLRIFFCLSPCPPRE